MMSDWQTVLEGIESCLLRKMQRVSRGVALKVTPERPSKDLSFLYSGSGKRTRSKQIVYCQEVVHVRVWEQAQLALAARARCGWSLLWGDIGVRSNEKLSWIVTGALAEPGETYVCEWPSPSRLPRVVVHPDEGTSNEILPRGIAIPA